jgi:hypothetical protein
MATIMGAMSCIALNGCGGGREPVAAAQAAGARAQRVIPVVGAPEPETAASRVAAAVYLEIAPENRPLVSRFALVVLNMYPSMGLGYMQGMINDLRAANPKIKLAQYIVLNEWSSSPVVASDSYAGFRALTDNGWWALDAQGRHVRWTDAYGNDDVNITDWAPPGADGRRWPQWKADYDTAQFFRPLSGLDYVFNDNVMYRPRYDADLMRIGTNQPGSDPAIMAAFRTGYVNYWNALRAANPGLKVIGNADNDLDSPEFKDRIEGAYNECISGIESSAGWDAMMARYRATLANTTAPHAVVFETCTASVDPARLRYGFASALLEDGYFAYTVSDAARTPYWADEFSAPLGTPAEPPPAAATGSGAWMRRYTHGLVLVNPTGSPLTVDVGAGYRRLSGSQDPQVNNGREERQVELPPRSGLLMVES